MNPIYKLLPSTCNEAIIADSAYYFTAKPCGRGHTVPRYTSNRHCMQCNRDDNRNSREMQRELHLDWELIERLTNDPEFTEDLESLV